MLSTIAEMPSLGAKINDVPPAVRNLKSDTLFRSTASVQNSFRHTKIGFALTHNTCIT